MAAPLIPLVAAIIGLGVLAQVLAARFEVPSIIFLIAAGVAMGPEGLGLVTPTSFGSALPTIVGLSVAIIVFEGAFHLRLDTLREAPSENIRLVTMGAIISFVGTAAVVRFALGVSWGLSALIGALLVATGPTVIAPILRVVPVRDRVGAALEMEGIVNDVTAAILAVVVFEAIVLEAPSSVGFVREFAGRLGTGLLVGLVVAALLWYLLWHVDLSPGNAPQNARLLVLAGALVAFGTAEAVVSEAGIAAVATAGVLLGNAGVPYESDITEFKGDVTLLVLSFVFIALAALLQFEDLLALGVGGVVVVVAVALLIRPIVVFLSTAGGRFSLAERAFMSTVGPRGIIPASVATLFAVELQATRPDAASILVGTVFLVILATVVVEGGLARYVAEFLDVIPMRVIVVGCGQVGRSIAERLEERGENVIMVENDLDQVEQARNEGRRVHMGDGTDSDELRAAGADNARIVVAATGDDDVNLLVAQLADSKFDVETIVARVNNPDNVEAFEDLGVRAISSALATAQAIDNIIERPSLTSWMGQLGRTGDVQEIEVTSPELIGRTIRDIGPDLPHGCLIALVRREGESFVPDADYALREGDRLTIIGQREAVREAMAFCHPDR